MKIETTICVKKSNLYYINQLADVLKVSRSQIISLLLMEAAKQKMLSHPQQRRVMYQERLNPSQLHRFHVSFSYELYERCLDMRKVFKFSVSCILDFAISRFYSKLLSSYKNIKSTDNYQLNYLFILKLSKDYCMYAVYWQIPGEIELQRLLE